MERYQTLQQIKLIYEEILDVGDAKLYLQKEAELDRLYHSLQSKVDSPYSQSEKDMLHTLSQLNQSVQSLVSNAMTRMQRTHSMSHKMSEHYEAPAYTDSYFFDKKH